MTKQLTITELRPFIKITESNAADFAKTLQQHNVEVSIVKNGTSNKVTSKTEFLSKEIISVTVDKNTMHFNIGRPMGRASWRK